MLALFRILNNYETRVFLFQINSTSHIVYLEYIIFHNKNFQCEIFLFMQDRPPALKSHRNNKLKTAPVKHHTHGNKQNLNTHQIPGMSSGNTEPIVQYGGRLVLDSDESKDDDDGMTNKISKSKGPKMVSLVTKALVTKAVVIKGLVRKVLVIKTLVMKDGVTKALVTNVWVTKA